MMSIDHSKDIEQFPNRCIDITKTPHKAFFSEELIALQPLTEMKMIENEWEQLNEL